MSLTERQKSLLKAIIQEFMDTAEAVGSLTLSEKYNLGVSPATVRSEMAALVKQGYLYKEHSSSGRTPTTLGLRYFLDKMLIEDELDTLDQARLKEQIFQKRFDRGRIIAEAVKALSQLSKLPAFSLMDSIFFMSGTSKLLNHPEFQEYELLQDTLDILESESILGTLLKKYHHNEVLSVLVGDEMGIKALKDCSLVYTPFKFFRGKQGYLAAIGPKRMHYAHVIPAVRMVRNFIENSICGWE